MTIGETDGHTDIHIELQSSFVTKKIKKKIFIQMFLIYNLLEYKIVLFCLIREYCQLYYANYVITTIQCYFTKIH